MNALMVLSSRDQLFLVRMSLNAGNDLSASSGEGEIYILLVVCRESRISVVNYFCMQLNFVINVK